MHRLIRIAHVLLAGWLTTSTSAQATPIESITRIEAIERIDADSADASNDLETEEAPRRLETTETVDAGPMTLLSEVSSALELPECLGTDHTRGEAELESGIADLRDALQLEPSPDSVAIPAPEVVTLYRSALVHFDRACEWLGPRALERRAIALSLLGRNYEAYVNLLGFLRRVPAEQIDERTRARVEANQARYERLLVGLLVQSTPLGARVEILDRPDLTLRTPTEMVFLAPREAPYEVRVTLEGHAPVRRSVSAALGARPVLELVLTPRSLPSAPVHTLSLQSTDEPRRWTTALLGVGLSAGVALVGAAVSHGIAEGRARTFNRDCVPALVGGCAEVRREYDRAIGIAIGGYALAGIASLATAFFAVLEWRVRRHLSAHAMTIRCSGSASPAAECLLRF